MDRTFHASQAAEVSDLINLKFATAKFGPRFLRASEPDGPSTGGGVKARQSLVLVTQDEIRNGLGGVLCGFIDATHQLAELRNYDVVSQHFQQRHQIPFDVPPTDYEAMLESLRAYLETQGIHPRIEAAARAPSIRPKPRPKSKVAPATPAAPSPMMQVWPMLVTAAAGFALCYILVRLGIIR